MSHFLTHKYNLSKKKKYILFYQHIICFGIYSGALKCCLCSNRAWFWNRKYVSTNFSEQNSVFSGEWPNTQVPNRTVQHLKNFIFFLQFCPLQIKYGIESDLGQFSLKFSVIIGCFYPVMSIRFCSGVHLKYFLKFCSLNLCSRPTSETYRDFVAWIKPFVLCVFFFFLEGPARRETFDVSESSYIQSHTFHTLPSHPVNSSLFWSHFSSWRRINCTSKRGSTPPHSDTCCDHRLCTLVLLHFMLLRLCECPTTICESVKKNLVKRHKR